MAVLLVISEDTSTAEMIEAIISMSEHAHRQQCVIAKFTTDEPTAWDMAHQSINTMIDALAETATCKTCGLTRAHCERIRICCAQCRHE